MSSNKFHNRSIRSHSIHVAIDRDFNRIKALQKQDIKQEKDFHNLERKITSRAKWTQYAEEKHLRQNSINNNTNSKQTSMTLDEFIQRQRIKQDNIINAKKVANQRIRHN